jgi:carboxymethylenebutenolidase
MKLDTSWVQLDVGGTPAQAYLARPARRSGPLPGVLVIQEAFGVDGFIADFTERLAASGYAALAPDLFSYGGKPAPLDAPRVEDAVDFLDVIPQSAWFDPAQRALELEKLPQPRRGAVAETLAMLLVSERPWAQYVATLRAGRELLSRDASQGAGVGCVGFCLGGALSMRLACADPEIAAAVACYGFAPPAEAIPELRAPILALYAENDPRINAGVPALVAAMDAAGKRFSHHTYPGTSHAFVNDVRRNFHNEAARQAWARMLGFFATELSPAP